jgi:hypothetical protein
MSRNRKALLPCQKRKFRLGSGGVPQVLCKVPDGAYFITHVSRRNLL